MWRRYCLTFRTAVDISVSDQQLAVSAVHNPEGVPVNPTEFGNEKNNVAQGSGSAQNLVDGKLDTQWCDSNLAVTKRKYHLLVFILCCLPLLLL